jgi:DNA-binding NarL/FixJ family response regulator
MGQQVTIIASHEAVQQFDLIAQSNNFHVSELHTLSELISNLSSSNVCSELIVIDLSLITSEQICIYDILNMISTINKCVHKTIKLAILIDDTSSTSNVKDCLSTSINGIIPQSTWLGKYETEHAILELLSGNNYKPKSIINKLKKTTSKKSNQITLTCRQEQICSMICKMGYSNKLIARQLNIAESTVKLHVTAIFKKYNVRTRTQLAVFMKQSLEV